MLLCGEYWLGGTDGEREMMEYRSMEKRLIALEKRERATGKLLNMLVHLLVRDKILKEKNERILEEETLQFHEDHGLNVERLDRWLKEGGTVTIGELTKKE